MRPHFNWFQYRTLISIKDKEKREYYELEGVKNNWNSRELERQSNSQLYFPDKKLLENEVKKWIAEVLKKGEKDEI